MFYRALSRCSLTRIRNMFYTQLTRKIGLFFFLNQISPEIFDGKKCQLLISTQMSIYSFQYYVNNKIFNKNSLNLEMGYKSSSEKPVLTLRITPYDPPHHSNFTDGLLFSYKIKTQIDPKSYTAFRNHPLNFMPQNSRLHDFLYKKCTPIFQYHTSKKSSSI